MFYGAFFTLILGGYNMKILFLGGDERMKIAYGILKNKHTVSSLGLFPDDCGKITEADAIVLPVPATRDGKTVNCPLTEKSIPLCSVDSAKENTRIITYGYGFGHKNEVDYSKLDDFCIKNAVATAEGAIAFAINATDFTLSGSRILIIGFGRIGKILFSRLLSFGADITVSARKASDLSYIEALGAHSLKTSEVAAAAYGFDIIFNTVDAPVISDPASLEKAYLFDLSTKGCTDFFLAEKSGVRAFKLPSIPAKTAPLSAGKIIAETVENNL